MNLLRSTPMWMLGLPLAVAYLGSLVWVWDMWFFREAYYSHGPLVVLAVMWLVHDRRREWQRAASSVDPRGWWLLGPALAMHAIGGALTIDSLSAASLVPAIAGLVWLGQGRARLGALLSILGLLLFAIPTPLVIQSRMAFELKEWAVEGGLLLAQLLGVGAERVGSEVRIPGQSGSLIVADACSGLRSLVALITLGYGIAFFMGPQRGIRRWAILAAAAPVAVATNAVRIGAICVLASGYGTEFASTTGHDWISGAVWLVDLGLLLGLDAALSRRRTVEASR
ncbi:MAG: exosortase/archaeosortase family protein [Planctomycetota bacterium]|nr:exosortase/archaeosortase family protein [Planctomycetota bacterium]MDA0931859.1 exosortase/archaeosortase family protein [Planctomycetota bacterium]MDA1222218.1 exosortase/archaeosortase family protein [Planctomycetota bacterium]